MRFWDSSALVPLVVNEPTSEALRALFVDPQPVAVWWGAEVECTSAIAGLERSGELLPAETQESLTLLGRLAGAWTVVDPMESVRLAAKRLLRVHDLRAADALQLAAAWIAAEGRPDSLEIVCLDQRLTAAAQREGFSVVDLSAG